ncbi:hypothetical protein NA57DRAFT_18581, partial [Rhizodiscina lignyota]
NPQHQSPLFNKLPGELRNEIFKWMLVPYDDPDPEKHYSEDSYWYRPGFEASKKVECALLQTCKLIYCESRRAVMREAEHPFWFGASRGPPGRAGTADCIRFFTRGLSNENVEDLTSVHFFTQMYWIEDGSNLAKIFRLRNFRPKRLTITFRYSDWWYWESNEDLRMSEEWLARFDGPPGLKELCVEYETLAWKKSQLDAIVARNKDWKLAVQDGNHLSAADTKLEEWKWNGPSKLAGQTWGHHGDSDTVEYVVVVDRW